MYSQMNCLIENDYLVLCYAHIYIYKHKIYIIHIYAAYISGIQTAKVGPTPGHFDHIEHATNFNLRCHHPWYFPSCSLLNPMLEQQHIPKL